MPASSSKESKLKALPKICKLKCPVMNYAWGKMGSSSAVAQLSGKEIDAKEPYAELWMGTHHKGPAIRELGNNSEALSEVLGEELPYLFKVLSVAKALSIQAHPDKKLAEKLHAERPNIYKDPNHKPEMTCAVTKFEAMCGFRVVGEIADYLVEYPEFGSLVGKSISESFSAAAKGADEAAKKAQLQKLFTTVMEADKKDVSAMVEEMCERISQKDSTDDIEKLILRLNKQYPLDVGCFAPLFLNYLVLQPGEAMFLTANEPHAYLDGDCIECMACSDNVVRAGLTPKLRDTPTLCSMLTYRAMKPDIMHGETLDDCSTLYSCPIDEFELTVTRIPASKIYNLTSVKGHALVLIYEGEGTVKAADGTELKCGKGSVLFVAGSSHVEFAASSDIVAYRCATKGVSMQAA